MGRAFFSVGLLACTFHEPGGTYVRLKSRKHLFSFMLLPYVVPNLAALTRALQLRRDSTYFPQDCFTGQRNSTNLTAIYTIFIPQSHQHLHRRVFQALLHPPKYLFSPYPASYSAQRATCICLHQSKRNNLKASP